MVCQKRDELASNRFSHEIAVWESSLIPRAVQRRRQPKLLEIHEMGFSAICLQGQLFCTISKDPVVGSQYISNFGEKLAELSILLRTSHYIACTS
jgi:hypothetical protein